MKRTWILALVLVAAGGCKSKATESQKAASAAAAKLTDLSASLDAAKTSYNARKQEARFVALLSPS